MICAAKVEIITIHAKLFVLNNEIPYPRLFFYDKNNKWTGTFHLFKPPVHTESTCRCKEGLNETYFPMQNVHLPTKTLSDLPGRNYSIVILSISGIQPSALLNRMLLRPFIRLTLKEMVAGRFQSREWVCRVMIFVPFTVRSMSRSSALK